MTVEFGLSREDSNLIISLACSLAEKPGENWIERVGGSLPEYVCQVAKAIKKSGKDTSTAIAMAISRIKRWAATGEGDTKAKASKAIAEWEALKAKRGKKSSKVKASNTLSEASEVLVMLSKATTSTPDYSMDSIRSAWDSKRAEARKQRRKENPTTWMSEEDSYDHGYVREVWNRWLIVRSYRDEETFYRVPYSVATSGDVSFGTPSEVKQSYVDVVTPDDTDGGVSDGDLKRLMVLSGPCVAESFVDLGPIPNDHRKSLVELSRVVPGVVSTTSYVHEVTKWGEKLS